MSKKTDSKNKGEAPKPLRVYDVSGFLTYIEEIKDTEEKSRETSRISYFVVSPWIRRFYQNSEGSCQRRTSER